MTQEQHVVPTGTYYGIFAVLMILLLATVGVSYVHLGRWNVIAALTIAGIKAVLILLYFMHIRYSSRLLWVFVGAGVFWLGIMFALAFSDYLTRAWLPAPTIWN